MYNPTQMYFSALPFGCAAMNTEYEIQVSKQIFRIELWISISYCFSTISNTCLCMSARYDVPTVLI